MVAGTVGYNTPWRICGKVINFGSRLMAGLTTKEEEVVKEPPVEVSDDTSRKSLMALVSKAQARDFPETM